MPIPCPVRCTTCGAVIANKHDYYLKLIRIKNFEIKDALDAVGAKRFCCRGAIMGHVEKDEYEFASLSYTHIREDEDEENEEEYGWLGVEEMKR